MHARPHALTPHAHRRPGVSVHLAQFRWLIGTYSSPNASFATSMQDGTMSNSEDLEVGLGVLLDVRAG